MNWIFRIGAILLGIFLIVFLALAALVWWDATFGKTAQDYANTTYPAPDGTTLYAYVAKPAAPGPHPAVIMLHEFYGLNQAIVEQADALAREGYLVLAPDKYRNQTTELIPRALLLRLTVPEERVMQDIQSAFDYLQSQSDADPQRIAVLGFCYGGEMALQHALRNSELAAVIVLYGSPVTSPEGLGVLAQSKSPVLGIFAEHDQTIPPSEARAFEQALTTAGIPNQVTIYPGVGHAFVQPESVAKGGAAKAAWESIIQFLEKTLKSTLGASSHGLSDKTVKLAIREFRAHSLVHSKKFDARFLCRLAFAHWSH
jgi:carboxymethylenebutenolidase